MQSYSGFQPRIGTDITSNQQVRNDRVGLVITKFLIQETGTYNEQFRRPYQTVGDDANVLRVIQSHLLGVETFTPNMMNGIASSFISPTAVFEKKIDISNGWDQPRMRFMLESVNTDYTGTSTTEVVLGYTDHNGIIAGSGSLDPNMEFYINSIVRVRNSRRITEVGNQSYSSVFDNSHLLVNSNWTDVFDSQPEHQMRPEDIFSTMSRSHLHGLGDIIDGRNVGTNVAVKSRRSNNVGGSYMASVVQGYMASSAGLDEFGQNAKEILTEARKNYGELPTLTDPFLSAIAGVRNSPIGKVFTLRDLYRICPHLDNVTRAQALLPVERATVHRAGQSEYWDGSDRTTVVATILSQSVPAIMMDLGITNVIFKATNETFGNQINVDVFEILGFNDDLDLPGIELINKLKNSVLRDISFNGQHSFCIEMKIDLMGETRILISINRENEVEFVTPSFCDALSVPVLTNSEHLNMKIANDFSSLFTYLGDSGPAINNFGKTSGQTFGNI